MEVYTEYDTCLHTLKTCKNPTQASIIVSYNVMTFFTIFLILVQDIAYCYFKVFIITLDIIAKIIITVDTQILNYCSI